MSQELDHYFRYGIWLRLPFDVTPNPDFFREFEIDPGIKLEENFADFVNRLIVSAVLEEDPRTGKNWGQADIYLPEEITNYLGLTKEDIVN